MSNPVYDSTTDPTLTLSNENVRKAMESVKNGGDRVYVIYTDGIFDLFHIGHMNVLKQSKFAFGDPSKVFLIAGVCSDADTLKYKGLPVMDGPTRAESVSHCKWVDKVIPDAPWHLTPEFIEEHNIDFVAHDPIPYTSGGSEDVYAPIKKMGKFLATERTDGISTSDIIVQILKDYDAYVERNLSRGFNKKQLNVGKTWEIRAVAHEKGKKLDATLVKLRDERKLVVDKIRQFFREIEKHSIKDSITDSLTGCNKSRKHKHPQYSAEYTLDSEDSSKEDEDPSIHYSIDEEDENAANSDDVRVRFVDETFQIVKHSFRLCGTMCEIAGVALSYLNVFHYMDKCKQTRKYQKQD